MQDSYVLTYSNGKKVIKLKARNFEEAEKKAYAIHARFPQTVVLAQGVKYPNMSHVWCD